MNDIVVPDVAKTVREWKERQKPMVVGGIKITRERVDMIIAYLDRQEAEKIVADFYQEALMIKRAVESRQRRRTKMSRLNHCNLPRHGFR